MPGMDKLTMIKTFKLVKYPIEELLPPVPHATKVRRLYKKALRLSIPAPWGSHLNIPFLSRFTHQGRASHFVRETFRQRKRETDPRLIKQYVYEAEQFVAQWERAEPAPADMYSRGGALYQRNDPFPEIYLRPEAHVDFEELNKLESESDYYIARYKKSQQEALEETFGGDKSKKTL